MYPILIKIGPFTLRTYGLLIAVGLFFALKYIEFRLKKHEELKEKAFNLVLYTVIAGLIGARLSYVALNWQFYKDHLLSVFKIWEGGLVFYGGFLAGIVVVLFYTKRHREIKLLKILDIFAPALALSHFFGRIGCFSAGCCYGKSTSSAISVIFTNPESLAPLNICLYPVQVYEALGNLVLFVFLHWFDKYKLKDGHTALLYVFLYSILRFHTEFLRGDDRGGYLLWFSPAQAVSIILIMAVVLIIRRRNNEQKD